MSDNPQADAIERLADAVDQLGFGRPGLGAIEGLTVALCGGMPDEHRNLASAIDQSNTAVADAIRQAGEAVADAIREGLHELSLSIPQGES